MRWPDVREKRRAERAAPSHSRSIAHLGDDSAGRGGIAIRCSLGQAGKSQSRSGRFRQPFALTKAMRNTFLIGTVAVLAGCAGLSTRTDTNEAEGHWQGVVVRGRFRQSITVDLQRGDSGWVGVLNRGHEIVPIDRVTVGRDSIHFETRDNLAFDGKLEGASMAGFLSGPTTGSFALSRDTTDPFAVTGDLEPRRAVLIFGR